MSLLERLAAGELVIQPQPQARLLSLPVELRFAIHDYAFEERTLHMQGGMLGRRDTPFFYTFRYVSDIAVLLYPLWFLTLLSCFETHHGVEGYTHRKCESEMKQLCLLGLPLTCRQLVRCDSYTGYC